MTLIRQSLAVAATFLLAAGCDGVDSVGIYGEAYLTVNPASISAVPGDTVRIRLTDDRGRTVRPTVLGVTGTAATIDTAGLVTARVPGTGVVSITAVIDGVTATASVPVTVLGFTLTPASASVAPGGGTFTFRPTFVGDSARYGTLVWSSSDTSVATVGADGRVVGRNNTGVVRITAVSSVDPRLRAEAEVAVACGCPTVQSLTVTPITVTLQPGATQQLTASVVIPVGAPASVSRDVTYASSDTTVATVSATGLITARRNGTATVTVAAVAAPTVTQQVAVTVRDPHGDRITIQSVTAGDPPANVDLNAVRGRIRLTVNASALFDIRRAELWVAGRRAAVREDIGRATTGDLTTFTLDVDTAERDAATGARLYPNGTTTFELRVEYLVGGSAPQSATIQLQATLANP